MQKMKNLDEIKEAIQRSPLVLLLIKAGNCGVCEAVQFKVSELLKSYSRVKGMYVFKEDVPEMASEYVVFSAPTLLLFVEGKERYRISRFVRFDELERVLQIYEEELEL